MEISLNDILNAREARAKLQQQLLRTYNCPVISYTMNIAGPVKNTPLIQRGFQAGLQMLQDALQPEWILHQHIDLSPTGCCAIFAVETDATRLKEICTQFEENTPLGRLFDMDVLDSTGNHLKRKHARGCMVCGAPGRSCAVSRMHSVSELQAVTNALLESHFRRADRAHISMLAVESLIEEVHTTPKPGLVDRRNSGSHSDMTRRHFLKSAKALSPYFAACVEIGQDTAHLPPEETFISLRAAGVEAEKAMYQATGGVNTHKGAIYTMGILCGSLGRLWTPENPFAEVSTILNECSKIAEKSVAADLSAANGATAGQRCYLQYGLKGIRGEVASGLPSVTKIALPCYRQALADGHAHNKAGVITLLHLIANVADTNLYKRGGKEGALWAAQAANMLLPNPRLSDVSALDDAFIARNLSPGGCADLLAVTYFLHKLT